MPKVESDTLALADGNVGGSVENLAVQKYVAFSAVNRPAGISRAGIRLLPKPGQLWLDDLRHIWFDRR